MSMAPTQSKDQSNQGKQTNSMKRGNFRVVPAPIDLARPAEKINDSNYEFEKIKCRTNPSDPDSTTYEVPLEYFATGTPEEWLLWKAKMFRCLAGQNATNGPTQFTFARRLLKGQALTVFENEIGTGAETLVSFKESLKAVTADIFPKKALVTQLRHMRRFLRKPYTMSVRDYVARVVEINSYLTEFPPVNATTPAAVLGEPELLDLLEFGVPLAWQRDMVMHGFDPSNGSIKDFTKFCERLERTEGEVEDQIPLKKKGNFEKRQGEKPFLGKDRSSHKSKHYCLLHGPNGSHDTNDCTKLKKEAEKQKKPSGKKFPKKINQYGDEVHTLIEFAKEAMKEKQAEKRRKTKHELNNFERLTVSDSENP